MGKIIVYNSHIENHSQDKNNFYIGRPSILSNPFNHIKDKETLAKYVVSTREEAIKAYCHYFQEMYQTNEEFKKTFDDIFEKYKNGEDIYLECFCKPLSCHGDYIAKMLQKKLLENKK